MKAFGIILILLSASIAGAKGKSSTLLEVGFTHDKKVHQYFLTKTSAKTPVFTLSFKDEKRKLMTRQISQSQANFITGEATRLIWENQYRKPATSDNCHPYVDLKTDVDKTRICYENRALTARAFGFLNSLNASATR
jgi:hypothetical protein